MKIEIEDVNCTLEYKEPKINRLFKVGCFTFNYETSFLDKNLIKKIYREAENLANNVNPGAANDASKTRDFQRILINSCAGMLAEFCWKYFLNILSIETLAVETKFVEASNQIDLFIPRTQKKIEVRSSFPRNGINFAICNPEYEFDIIGPYSNEYKPSEINKDFYLRTLYPIIYTNYFDLLSRDEFKVYLTGGATWDMICDDSIAIKKSFIPEDEINITRLETKTDYRVIPYSKALDTIQIYNEINKK